MRSADDAALLRPSLIERGDDPLVASQRVRRR